MTKLKPGSKAPNFSLKDSNGNKISLSDFLGSKVVVYFYPKDDTPGCTIEAHEFRDDFNKFQKNKITVMGISPDSEESHKKFCNKYKLPFILLSDIGHKVAEKYGVWVEKNMYGKKYFGILRSTFLIDESGKIKKIYAKVTPKGHSKEVLVDFK